MSKVYINERRNEMNEDKNVMRSWRNRNENIFILMKKRKKVSNNDNNNKLVKLH